MCQQPQQRQDQLRQKQVKRLFPGQTLRLQEEAQKETRLEGGSWLALFFFFPLSVLYECGGGWRAWMETEVSLSVAHLVRMWPPSWCACVGSDPSLASFVTVTDLLHCNCRGTGAELGGIPCPAGAPSASRQATCVQARALWAAVCMACFAGAELGRPLPTPSSREGNPSLAFIPEALTLPLPASTPKDPGLPLSRHSVSLVTFKLTGTDLWCSFEIFAGEEGVDS